MGKPSSRDLELMETVQEVGGIIVGTSEGRYWIEIFFEGDLMHSQAIDLPPDMFSEIFVEEIPHKSTVYEQSRTIIYLDGPCDLQVWWDGTRVIIRGSPSETV